MCQSYSKPKVGRFFNTVYSRLRKDCSYAMGTQHITPLTPCQEVLSNPITKTKTRTHQEMR